MASRPKARLIGMGSYLPSKVLNNRDLEELVATSDEWITSRTGVRERRIAGQDEFPSDMGAKAAQIALEKAGLSPNEIGIVLVATMSPDYISPSTAALVQHKIGATQAAAMDIQAACSGYLYALSAAKAYVESGIYRNVLVVAAEKMSAFVDYQDRRTCIIFGDGASASVVAAEGAGLAIDAISLGACGELAGLFIVPAGGSKHPASQKTVNERQHYMQMEGNQLFKHAVRSMTLAGKNCLQAAGLTEAQISWVVPHQANERIIDATAKNFDLPLERVCKTIAKYGNTSAAGIAITLDELEQAHPFQEGEHLLLMAFGGGLTWGACILTKIS